MAYYGVMRIEKYRKNDLYAISRECNRSVEDHLNGKEFPGSDIDWSKTDNNIYLVPKNNNWNKTINEMLEKYNLKARSNSVLCIGAIYTFSPGAFERRSQEEIIDYFKCCLEFHKRVYGNHVISCVIHVDESNLHMHVHSCAIKERVNKDGSISYSLSAKDICGNKKAYSERQTRFFEECSSLFGLERGEILANDEKRKHLTKMEYEIQEMEIKAQKAKAELDIRQRVLDACSQPMEQIEVLSSTNENTLLKKPSTLTVRTADLERLQAQVKTAKDLQNGLNELNKLAKETLELASTDERVLEYKERLRQSQSHCKQLEQAVNEKQNEIGRLTSYIQKLEQWFNTVKEWIHKRKLIKDFEYYIEYETKELVREEIEYEQDFERG